MLIPPILILWLWLPAFPCVPVLPFFLTLGWQEGPAACRKILQRAATRGSSSSTGWEAQTAHRPTEELAGSQRSVAISRQQPALVYSLSSFTDVTAMNFAHSHKLYFLAVSVCIRPLCWAFFCGCVSWRRQCAPVLPAPHPHNSLSSRSFKHVLFLLITHSGGELFCADHLKSLLMVQRLKRKRLKPSNVIHMLPRGNILNNKKITNKNQLTDQFHPFPSYLPFLARTDPSEKLLTFYSPPVGLYMGLLKPRSKYLLLPISRIYTPNSLDSYKVSINPQNCFSDWKLRGITVNIYIYMHTHTHFL